LKPAPCGCPCQGSLSVSHSARNPLSLPRGIRPNAQAVFGRSHVAIRGIEPACAVPGTLQPLTILNAGETGRLLSSEKQFRLWDLPRPGRPVCGREAASRTSGLKRPPELGRLRPDFPEVIARVLSSRRSVWKQPNSCRPSVILTRVPDNSAAL
jgi:hypothetical protein